MEYIETRSRLNELSGVLHEAPLLALDTEAAGYHRYLDNVCLVQLSTREQTYVIDALAVDITPLGKVLADPSIEIVLHDADFDLRLLKRDHGIRISRLFDTKLAAQFLGEAALGLAGLAEKHLGVRLDKKHQRADWAKRPLPRDLLEYAADDTRHLPALRDVLQAQLESAGRRAWAEEEFQIRERAPLAVDGDEAWLRLKNTRDLGTRELGGLRELYAWRDGVARTRDVAPFRVLANETLVAIARRMPENAAALREVAGVSSTLFTRYGPDLLRAIERARNLPAAELPVRRRGPRRPPPDPELDARVERLKQVRDRTADALGLERGFLMPRQQLEDAARLRPANPAQLRDVPDIREWQIEAFGRALLGALAR
jgi:ribonuclease D